MIFRLILTIILFLISLWNFLMYIGASRREKRWLKREEEARNKKVPQPHGLLEELNTGRCQGGMCSSCYRRTLCFPYEGGGRNEYGQ